MSMSPQSFQRVATRLPTANTAVTISPSMAKAILFSDKLRAPLLLVDWGPEEVAAVLGAEGTNVDDGLARHELSAAAAAEDADGAAELTVPLPPKLHARGSFF